MKNRRNYYRILQVQPDAPAEIIRASYHALLKGMKIHPDLGGDDLDAAQINEAYETLSNVRKHTEYDKGLLGNYMNEEFKSRFNDHMNVKGPSPAIQAQSLETLPGKPETVCYAVEDNQGPDITRECDRRSIRRVKKGGKISYDAAWLLHDQVAEMQDLSPLGIRFLSSKKLMTNLTVKITSHLFKALAQITSSEQKQLNGRKVYSTGARFFSVKFKSQKGSFYSKVVNEAFA